MKKFNVTITVEVRAKTLEAAINYCEDALRQKNDVIDIVDQEGEEV